MVIWSAGGELGVSRLPSGLASARTGKKIAGMRYMVDVVGRGLVIRSYNLLACWLVC